MNLAMRISDLWSVRRCTGITGPGQLVLRGSLNRSGSGLVLKELLSRTELRT